MDEFREGDKIWVHFSDSTHFGSTSFEAEIVRTPRGAGDNLLIKVQKYVPFTEKYELYDVLIGINPNSSEFVGMSKLLEKKSENG